MWRRTFLFLGTLTWRKLWNFIRIWRSFYRSRRTGIARISGMPVKIGIEPTTSCNLRCPECPSGLRSFTRPRGMLAPADFHKTIDDLAPDLCFLLMYFQGEPYLNRDFLDMAAYAAGKNIYTGTSTNGHYLDLETAHKTVKSGIHEVVVSIDGTTQDVYEQYRVGGSLEKALEGLRNLVHARKVLKSSTPAIILQFLVVGPNEHQIPEIKKLGREIGVDEVVLKTAQIYDYEHGSPLIPRQERYSRYVKGSDGKYRIRNLLENQCWKMWQGCEITWDGRVLPCCFDKDAEFLMGKLPETPFVQIWNSSAYQHFRNQILKGRSEITMCRNCSEGTRVFAD